MIDVSSPLENHGLAGTRQILSAREETRLLAHRVRVKFLLRVRSTGWSLRFRMPRMARVKRRIFLFGKYFYFGHVNLQIRLHVNEDRLLVRIYFM